MLGLALSAQDQIVRNPIPIELGLLRLVHPTFPNVCGLNMKGYVIVEGAIDLDGNVVDVEVLRGLGKGRFGFEEAAVEAFKQWRFKVVNAHGEPLSLRITEKLYFHHDPFPVPVEEWLGESDPPGVFLLDDAPASETVYLPVIFELNDFGYPEQVFWGEGVSEEDARDYLAVFLDSLKRVKLNWRDGTVEKRGELTVRFPFGKIGD